MIQEKIYKWLNSFELGCKILRFYYKKLAQSKGIKVVYKNNVIELIRESDKSKMLISSDVEEDLTYVVANFDEQFDCVYPIKIEGYNVVDFSIPKEHTLKQSGISLYFSSMAEGEWPLEGYFKKYLPKEGDIVFDCGSYCGLVTYFLSKYVGETGKVYTFEPDDSNYDMLLKNIAKHNLSNVIPVKAGIYSKTTTLSFSNRGSLGCSLVDDVQNSNNSNIKQIEVMSLADAYDKFNLDRLDYVKMDIEGAEVDAISGSRDFIKNNNIHFAIAGYHQVDNHPSSFYLEKIFKDIGYECETGFEKHPTTWAQKEKF